MYIAELKGKLSSKLERSEDILTSNVFSFFKYTNRSVFLNALLKSIGLQLSYDELVSAQFIFWPRFDDNTEPDLVIIAGDYYLLFEAKYFSGFGEETKEKKSQLNREIEGGISEAKVFDKEFMLIAITADYYFKKEKFDELNVFSDIKFKWINWQLVSEIIRDYLEQCNNKNSDYIIASDLYELLEKKNLRGFRAFSYMHYNSIGPFNSNIFFKYETASFRGGFIGFRNLLKNLSYVQKQNRNQNLFFAKKFFSSLKLSEFNTRDNLFLKGDKNL